MGAGKYKRVQKQNPPKGSKADAKKVVISYLYLDRTQGQTLEQWDKAKGRLLRWNNIILKLNNCTPMQAFTQNIIIRYNDLDADLYNMPKKSKWKFPQTLISKEVVWCKIIIMQIVRVIGFLEDNIFYVVFFDEKHEFYPTEPKNS